MGFNIEIVDFMTNVMMWKRIKSNRFEGTAHHIGPFNTKLGPSKTQFGPSEAALDPSEAELGSSETKLGP